MKNKILLFILFYIFTVYIFIMAIFFSDDLSIHNVPAHKFIVFFAGILLIKYFIYMLVSPWYDVYIARRYKKFKSRVKTPKVSIIIPAWNEEVGIVSTIKSVLHSYYKNIEIIVVNDGSTDSTERVIQEYIATLSKKKRNKIIYKYKENGGKGKALNKAIEISSGEIIITIDADCLVKKSAIGNFVKYFDDPTVMAAVGNVKIGDTSRFIGTVQYLEFLFSFYFKKADALWGSIYIIGGAAGAFRREIFKELGNFSTASITEDIDLSMRIQHAGYKIIYASDAIVYTEPASDIKSLMSQRFRWKIGRLITFYNYRKLFFSIKNKHNKILSFFILPLALFGELQLLLEIPFLAILYAYTLVSGDYTVFISGIFIVSYMFAVQILFDNDRNSNKKKLVLFLLAPIGWLIFYLSVYVEVKGLHKTIRTLIFRDEVHWQNWKRIGIGGKL